MFLSKFFCAIGFVSLVAVAACSSSTDPSGQSDSLSAGIVRDGTTTAAALKEFLGTPPDDWPWAGGQFQTPMDQAVLPAATPYTFTWQADSTTPPGPNDVLDPNKQQGQVFMLVFDTPATAATANHLLRVFTNQLSDVASTYAYTPSAEDWQKLVGAGDVITLSITSATFENDELTSDGTPHSGETIHFTVQ